MRYGLILETADFIAVNKPAGMLSIPDRAGEEISLKQLLKEKYGDIYTIHRLDKGTSGVIVFARNEQVHKQLSQLFESREVEKYYLGLVQGKPVHEKGTVEAPIMQQEGKQLKMITHAKGKPSRTDYELLETFRSYSWLRFRIHTGRTHQIRVHMQYLGHPIVCDELYGSGEPVKLSSIKRGFKLSNDVLEERPLLSRLALHSSELKFTLNSTEYNLEAELPKDLRAALQQLRKWNR
ncbi:MAG TPA: RNA pseudouridine synthase [Chitinophagaceae bacterium]